MAKGIFGAFLVLFGLGLFFDQTPLRLIGLNFNTIMSLFWAGIGVMLYIKRHMFWGSVFFVIGLLGILSGVLHFNTWQIFFPVIVIAIGISILFRSPEKWAEGRVKTGSASDDEINESVVLSSLERKYLSQNFKGGKLDSVFAGYKLDLREVKLAKGGATIEINTVFGGGEILVSNEMRVISDGTAIMGAWTNKYDSAASSDAPLLILKGAVVFGGVEVKN